MTEQILARPSELRIKAVARLVAEGDNLVATFPVFDREYNDALGRLEFQFDKGRKVYACALSPEELDNRASEAVHDLLAIGLMVKADGRWIQAAERGDYAPLATRKVVASKRHPDSVLVKWGYFDHGGDVAIHLPGARWASAKRTIIVPAIMGQEVADFAAKHGFFVTPEAQAAMEAAEAEMLGAHVVDVAPTAVAKPIVHSRVPKHIAAVATGIDPALLDNE